MANLSLTAIPPLGGMDHYIGANRITEQTQLALVSVAIARDTQEDLADRLQQNWGLAFPSPTGSTTSGDWRAISMTADQLLLIRPGDGSATERQVKEAVGRSGYTTNQTDAWAVLSVEGPDILPAMERICPINLTLPAFPVDASARTAMEHLGVLVVRLSEHRLLLLSASSSALSFAHSVETSFRHVVDEG